jgi:hypothetical protein
VTGLTGSALGCEFIPRPRSTKPGGARTVVSPATLYRMKRDTVREKDRVDAAALRRGFDREDD